VKNVILIIRSFRFYQWIKNVLIFAPTFFSLTFFQLVYLRNSLIAFVLFGCITGSIYLLNDCVDKKGDQLHPVKKNRPIASGALSVATAISAAIIILCLTLLAIFLFNRHFFIIAAIYVILNLLYSIFLKKVVILDVLIIAVGFVFRVEIGGVVNQIKLSPWILIITFLGAIFLALIKRRQELVRIGRTDDAGIRKTLRQYNIALLDQLVSITTATTLISYIIYVLNADIQEKFGTDQLYLTIPFVVFGIFRYLFLTYSQGKGENPSEIIFTDLPFAINIILWASFFIMLITV
jgi:4-hydroxybenzoate polyprenyltransferase